jgi:glycosyltransferase involved in cell wall biosynthesis
MLAVHRLTGGYRQKIHTYIALTEFARDKFCEGGLPVERISVKPNFVPDDPGPGSGSGGYALFVGRLTEEKGLTALLDEWSGGSQKIPLKIAGDGPMQRYVRERSAQLAGVEYLGVCDHAQVIRLLKDAAFLVFPSRWYEGMPMVILESMACGTPVLAFGVGALNELIIDGVNGIKLRYSETGALSRVLSNSGQLIRNAASLRGTARAHFEENFTAEANYGLLLDIYSRALNQGRSIS